MRKTCGKLGNLSFPTLWGRFFVYNINSCCFVRVPLLCSAKTPFGYGETLIFLWPNLRNSPLKVVVDQQASVIVGFQPVVEVDLVQIGRYQFFAEFVSFRT